MNVIHTRKMNLLSIFPEDVAYNIMTFDASHRIKFAPSLRGILLKDVSRTGIKWRMKHIHKLCRSRRKDDVWTKENIEDPGYFVKMLSKCNCCERHMSRRPKSINQWGDSLPTGCPNPDGVYGDECDCICRHSCRWLIRIFNPTEEKIYDDEDY